MNKPSRTGSLLQSGLIFSVINFVTNLGNLGFQCIIARHLSSQAGEYGDANSILNSLIPLLGLLSAIAMLAITHYIAHFNACGDTARLQGLLLGCRKFLFRLTLAGSVLAIIAVIPAGHYFHYRGSLMLATLACTLVGLWVSLATALCQGLSWFKRLAFISFLMMVLRVLFGWFVTLKWPSAETVVMASIFMQLAFLVLLFWRKELKLAGQAVSPWNREFIHYFIVSAAIVLGGYFFTKSDLMVVKYNIHDPQINDAYNRAELLAISLTLAAGPLLTVLFTSRSGARSGNIVAEQMKLLCLYVVALLAGAGVLYLLRALAVRIMLGRYSPETEAMIGPLALTMVWVGLLQSLALWALASRWLKLSLLYGALGLVYWAVLFTVGKTPAALLHAMPIASAAAFFILLGFWLRTMWKHHPPAKN